MTKQEEQQLVELLSDPQTQRKAFERVVRAYSEQLYWHTNFLQKQKFPNSYLQTAVL